jgi:seryl-tRNA synthetase
MTKAHDGDTVTAFEHPRHTDLDADLPAAASADIDRARAAYRDELVAAGLLIPTGVAGMAGRNRTFEWVVEGLLRALAHRTAGDGAEYVRFPPLVSRTDYVRCGHLASFPQLGGSIHAFDGDDRAHRELLRKVEAGERWTDGLQPTEVVLTPAPCYPVYPLARGVLPEAGRLFDVSSFCFRHEPSTDPMRLLMFRQQEYVRIGDPAQICDWRARWLERSQTLFRDLQLPFVVEAASDPFFGRTGRFMASSQREQALKFEVQVPIVAGDRTACASLNIHGDRFAQLFEIARPSGALAVSACVGFGLERITLGLLRVHGLDPSRWPAAVRAVLEP